MNQFIHNNMTETLSEYFNDDIIQIIMSYHELTLKKSIKFDDTIKIAKQLSKNKLIIGFVTTEVCIYDVRDRTKITNRLIKQPSRKNYITSLCITPNNEVVFGMSKDRHLFIWNHETNTIRNIKISNGLSYIFQIIHIKDDIITYSIRYGSIHATNIIKLENTTTAPYNYFYTNHISKINNRINEAHDGCITVRSIESFISGRHYLYERIRCNGKIKKVIPLNEDYYMIGRKDEIICIPVKSEYGKYELPTLIGGCYKDFICINNNIIVLTNKIKIYDSIGDIFQIIDDNNIKLIENFNDGLLVVYEQHVTIYD